MWKRKSWERKLRNKHMGGRDGEDEFKERKERKGEKIWDNRIGEILKRNKGERKGKIN